MDSSLYLNINKGLLLIILFVSGKYITTNILSCRVQELLNGNVYVQYILLFIIIYFTIDFTTDDGVIVSPIENVKITCLVWVLFVMFAKMNLYFTIFTFSLFIITYYIQNQIVYYRKLNDKNEYIEKINSFISVEKKLIIFIIFTIILGFIIYFIKQYKDKKNEWSFVKFIFGTLRCDFENKKVVKSSKK
jgi:hypothetical protein